MFSRYHAFAQLFRGYRFFDIKTGEALSKHEVFATYFRSQYTTDGESLEFLNDYAKARFDLLVMQYQGKLTKVNRHNHYAIMDSPGWKDGMIINIDTFFTRPNPKQSVVIMKNAEGIV